MFKYKDWIISHHLNTDSFANARHPLLWTYTVYCSHKLYVAGWSALSELSAYDFKLKCKVASSDKQLSTQQGTATDPCS